MMKYNCFCGLIASELDVDAAMEWLKDYAFRDEKEIYTNGTLLVPMFRVEQAFVHGDYRGFREG